MELHWNNGLGSRDRRAWLLFIKDGTVLPFKGENIPGVCVVLGVECTRNGKWSSTTFRLEVAEDVRPLSGREGWETGTFLEGLETATKIRPIHLWVEIANALGVTIPKAQDFLRSWRPKAAEKVDATEASLKELQDTQDLRGEDTAEVVLNFGSPTNRLMREGFWGWHVVVRVNGQIVGRVRPETDNWDCLETEGSLSVVECVRTAGMHGGYVSLRLAVPEGAVVSHEPG